MQKYVEWRMGRRDYAICLLIYFVAYFAIYAFVSASVATVALPPLWILTLAIPRLRDIGWSAWWSVAPFALGFAVGFLNALVTWVAGHPSPVGAGLLALVGFGSLAFMVLLAFLRGKPLVVEVFS